MTFGYGARVPYPIETNPNEGGGPIRRTPLVSVRMKPPAGNMVYRTPHAVTPDMEPGGAFEPRLWNEKFLWDGRLVPKTALGQADPADATQAFVQSMKHLVIWGWAGSALLGMTLGALFAKKGRRLRGLGVGAAAGFGTGVVATGLVGRGAAMASNATILQLSVLEHQKKVS